MCLGLDEQRSVPTPLSPGTRWSEAYAQAYYNGSGEAAGSALPSPCPVGPPVVLGGTVELILWHVVPATFPRHPATAMRITGWHG